MNAPTNIQVINGPDGRPAFVVIPHADYMRLYASDRDLIPHDVISRTVDGATPVRAWREHLSLTQAEVAKESGLKQADISKIETGLIQKTTGLLGLSRALRCRPEWLDTGDGDATNDENDLHGVRTGITLKFAYRHGIIQGGNNGFIDCVPPSAQDPEPVAYASTMRDEQAYAVKVRGNSMEPAIMQGWDVIASPNRPAQPPDLCVVYFADDRKALKRFLWQRDGLVCLESLHVDHKKMTEQASGILRMDKVIAIVPN